MGDRRSYFVVMDQDATGTQEITSTANPRVKWLAGLQRRRQRRAAGVTIVEGHDEIALAVASDVSIRNLYWCPALVAGSPREDLVSSLRGSGVDVVPLGRTAFEKVSYREGPDGLLAVVDDPTRTLAELALGPTPLVLVCEGVEKPGNLGAMLRTAEAAGVDAVIAASPVADWGNPNVVRASKGTLFVVPVAAAPLEEVLDWLRARRLRVLVATPEAEHTAMEVDLTQPCAVVVGAEHEGVSEVLKKAADDTARLPMVGRVNSLNVATAAALTLYEALRQRSR